MLTPSRPYRDIGPLVVARSDAWPLGAAIPLYVDSDQLLVGHFDPLAPRFDTSRRDVVSWRGYSIGRPVVPSATVKYIDPFKVYEWIGHKHNYSKRLNYSATCRPEIHSGAHDHRGALDYNIGFTRKDPDNTGDGFEMRYVSGTPRVDIYGFEPNYSRYSIPIYPPEEFGPQGPHYNMRNGIQFQVTYSDKCYGSHISRKDGPAIRYGFVMPQYIHTLQYFSPIEHKKRTDRFNEENHAQSNR